MEARNNPWVKTFRWSILLFSAVLLIEALLIVWTMFWPSSTNSTRDMALDSSDMTVTDLSAIEEFQEAVDRTLFSWNRKPNNPEGAAKLKIESELSARWELAGLVNTGKATYAIFSETNGDRRIRLEKGMKLENWTVDEVNTRQVALVNGEKRETYQLKATETQENLSIESTPTAVDSTKVPGESEETK